MNPSFKDPSGYRATQLPTMTPEASNLYNKLLGGVSRGSEGAISRLSRLASGDESLFKEMEAPAYQAFDKLLGQIGSRFSQFGARDSSAFQNAVAGQGAELAQNLSSQRNQIQNDAIMQLLGLSNQLLHTSPFENVLTPKNRDTSGMEWAQLIGQVAPQILELLL